MARFTFGASSGDGPVTQAPASNNGFLRASLNLSATGTFWSASTGGTQYTDLIDPNTSAALTGVSTDGAGRVVPFKGPDGIAEGWLDFGAGRFKVTAVDSGLYARKSVFHPRDYGGKGDGIAADDAAIQAAINAAVGGSVAAGASTTRIALGIVSLDGGAFGLNKWKITAPLQIYSIVGFVLQGDGDGCQIVVSGSLAAALQINGSLNGSFGGFSIIGATTSDTVTTAVSLEWASATAQRSTSGNRFTEIRLRNLKYQVGFGFGLSNPSAQVDNNICINCNATGQWTSGENTWWQSGYKSGNGTFANVLGHHFYDCGAYSNRYNYHVNALSGFNVYGGAVGGAQTDFYLQAFAVDISFQGIRSETSQRLMVASGGGAQTAATIRDTYFTSSNVPLDNQVIQWGTSGELNLDNVQIGPTTAAPIFYVNGSSARIAAINITGGCTASTAPALVQSIGVNAPFVATFRGYQQQSGAGQVIATWSELITTRGGVLKAPPGSTTQTTNYSISSTEDMTIFNGTSLTATLPDPTTVAAGLVLRVKNINASALTVNSAGTSKTIDGAASQSLAQWASGRYVSDGTQWLTV